MAPAAVPIATDAAIRAPSLKPEALSAARVSALEALQAIDAALARALYDLDPALAEAVAEGEANSEIGGVAEDKVEGAESEAEAESEAQSQRGRRRERSTRDASLDEVVAVGGGVSMLWFDFHRELKRGWPQALAKLAALAAPTLKRDAHFQARPDPSGSKAWAVARQGGVVRTNCVDCLDRTNVAQALFARQVTSSSPCASPQKYKKTRQGAVGDACGPGHRQWLRGSWCGPGL